jgi:coenzyme PQQ synthesis protein D (PqqD)
MPASTETLLRINSHDVAWREIGDELVVLHMGTAKYLTINGSGGMLWKCLIEGASRGQLVDALTERYGIDATRAEIDIETFLDSLGECQLLV